MFSRSGAECGRCQGRGLNVCKGGIAFSDWSGHSASDNLWCLWLFGPWSLGGPPRSKVSCRPIRSCAQCAGAKATRLEPRLDAGCGTQIVKNAKPPNDTRVTHSSINSFPFCNLPTISAPRCTSSSSDVHYFCICPVLDLISFYLFASCLLIDPLTRLDFPDFSAYSLRHEPTQMTPST